MNQRVMKTYRKITRGTIDPSTGLVFFRHEATYASGERWVKPEDLARLIAKEVEHSRKERKDKPWLERARRMRYRSSHKDQTRAYQRAYVIGKYHTDHRFRLLYNLRNRIRAAMKQGIKSSRTIALIGIGIDGLRNHLQKLFKPGMSWENHGKGRDKWNIDHIRPCSSFDLTDPEQQKLCFHYTNLQPLWEPENCSKGNRLAHNTI